MEQTQAVKAYVKRFNFFKTDYDLVRNRLKKNLESVVWSTEVNDAWKKFNGIMKENIAQKRKSFCNHVRSKQYRKDRKGRAIEKDDGNEEVIVDGEEAAEVFNKYLS